MKPKYLNFIALTFILISVSQARAGIRPSFSLESSSWDATDIVVATEGKNIDGVLRVLETLKGDLATGDVIKIPELGSFKSESSRTVSKDWLPRGFSSPFIVTGDRMVLFLRRESVALVKNTEESVAHSSASIRWTPAGFFKEFSVSVVWIEQGESFGFFQVMNPGPSVLIKFSSETDLKSQALEVDDIQKSLRQAGAISDPAARAAALEPFARQTLYPARIEAFEQLVKCELAALPVLRALMADDSLLHIHGSVVSALAEAGKNEAGPDLQSLIQKDLDFWRKAGPQLEKGWWNGSGFDSIEKVEPLRDRYSRDYETLRALVRRPYPKSEMLITEFRDLWHSLPQLGSDQLFEACNEALRELDRVKAKTNVVRFEGLRTFGEAELLSELHSKIDNLDKDSGITPAVIEKAKIVIRDYLASRGHLHASVVGEFEEASKSATFVIDEGKRAKVAEIVFQGNSVFAAEDLRKQMLGCVKQYDVTGYDAGVFDMCLRNLNSVMWNAGYLQARLDTEFKESNDGLVFTISVDEGVMYRIGKILVKGSTILTPNQVRAIIGLKEGETANGEVIGDALYHALKKYYGNHGFIQYTAELEPTFKNNPGKISEGVVDFEITIDEGKQFKIQSITFSGGNVSRQKLLDLFLIREGDVFNQELFDGSIQKLNDSGLVDEIDKDRQVDFRTDEAGRLLSLVITLDHEDRVNRDIANKANQPTLTRRQRESPR